MKPRNSYERMVVEKSTHLSPLNEEDNKHIDKMIDNLDFDCYCQIADEKSWNSSYGVSCRPSARRVQYYTRVDALDQNIIVRTWQVKVYKRGMRANAVSSVKEVVRKWHGENGNAVEALQMQPFNYDADAFIGTMQLRDNKYNEGCYSRSQESKYVEACTEDIRLNLKRLPHWLIKRGLDRNTLLKTNMSRAIELATTPNGEYLLKCGYKDLFMQISNGSIMLKKLDKYIYALKICARHNYRIKNYKDWFDMLGIIEENNGDTHSPKYICPADLNAMHQHWNNINSKRIQKQHEALELAKVRKREQQYYDGRHMFFGIAFCNKSKSLNIHVISSAREMYEEGKHMHHCVSRYSDLHNGESTSLILSCRDKDGNRVATIEVNIKTMKIEQIRGVSNSQPKEFYSIKKLINDNMHMIEDVQKRLAA